MTPDDLRALIEYLQQRVALGLLSLDGAATVTFAAPKPEDMLRAGLDPAGVKAVRSAPWWDEMVADVIDTPSFCGADEPPEEVLGYARDVIAEFLRKRVKL
ncbi:MAG: hypothetical protein V1750_10615 [Acidobacteriota bacterium]